MTHATDEALPFDRPATPNEARSAYADQVLIGYLLYGVGAITAFLAVALSLSDAAAALHSSVLAIGLLVAGLAGDRIDRAVGSRRAHGLGYLSLATACVCLATAPAFAVTLTGAGLVGIGTGLLLARVNRTLTRGGGALARVRMGRAALVAMVGSMAVPLAVGLAEASGLGWQLALVAAGGLLAVGLLAARDRGWAPLPPRVHGGGLGHDFWLAWWLIVLVVSVEFAIVFWASTLVERQVGISLADATIVATAFYAGMATTRVAISFDALGRRDPMGLMRFGLVVVFVGSLLAWASGDVLMAAVGIYLGGVGTGFQYPLGVSVALALVPRLGDRASARLILASGMAILVAPFVLGLAADAVGVSGAWLLIPTVCLAALALSVPVAAARTRAA